MSGTDLFRAHVEFSAHLASVTGIDWHWREGTQLLVIFLLIHGSDQSEVSYLHHVIHCEEDIRWLREKEKVVRMKKQSALENPSLHPHFIFRTYFKISVHKPFAMQEIHSFCNLQEDIQTLSVFPELRQTPLSHPVL